MIKLWQNEHKIYLIIESFLESEIYKLVNDLLIDNCFIKRSKFYEAYSYLINDNFLSELQSIVQVNGECYKEDLEVKDLIETYDIKYDESLLAFPPKNRLQKRTIYMAIKYEGSFHYHRMGVGKTYISLSIWNHYFHYGISDKLIIVCPGSVLYNWKYEILKFTKNTNSEDIYITSSKNRNPFESEARYVIMTYDSLRMVIKDIQKKDKKNFTNRTREIKGLENLLGNKKFCFIADEAHNVNRRTSLQSKAVQFVSEYANNVLNLTATPIRSEWQEKYVQSKLISPALVGDLSYSGFVKNTAITINPNSNIMIEQRPDQIEKWDNLWKTITFTGKLSIPQKNYIKVIWVDMSAKHKKLYKKLTSEKISEIDEKFGFIDSGATETAFIHLLMGLSDMSLVDHVIDIGNWKLTDNNKLSITNDLIKSHISNANNEKVIIWQENPKLLNSLSEHYQKHDPYTIHGQSGYSLEERLEVINDFNINLTRDLLIANSKVLGVGTNIQGANIAIHWNSKFDFVNFDQTTGRIYRQGQQKDCTQYVLIYKGTIEESAWYVIQKRYNINNLKLKYKSYGKDEIRAILDGKISKII